jgi:hypothetical protein
LRIDPADGDGDAAARSSDRAMLTTARASLIA